MRPAYPEALVRRLSSLCPAPWLAARLQPAIASRLASASLFLSPRAYARFLVSLLALAAPFQALAILSLPFEGWAPVLCSLATLQSAPFLILLSRANSRRRGVDAELPFFAMALSVLVKEANPTLQGCFRRVASLGQKVFPAFSKEGEILARDEALAAGSPDFVEVALEGHPSTRLRTLVRGFAKTLTTGKDVGEFVQDESSFQLQRLERSWSSFSGSVGSLAEVTFILLALFPVGLEMIGAAISGFASSPLFLASFAALGVATGLFLLLTDSIQPLVYDSPPSASWLAVSLASWAASTLAFVAGAMGAGESIAVPLVVSSVGFLQTRKRSSDIRRGEEEVSAMLHDLAEESRAGVSLPEALARLGAAVDSFPSVKDSFTGFFQATRLGLTPAEAQRRVDHPSWLVRMGFAMLSTAFETGAGFEQLEALSSLFRRVVEARRAAWQSMIPFVLVGAIVPAISVASISLLSGFSQQNAPLTVPLLAVHASRGSLVLSVSAVSVLCGVLLSKLLSQTVRHQVALPILLASTLVSLLVFGMA